MNNEEILKRAIIKAKANGFVCPFDIDIFHGINLSDIILIKPEGYTEPFVCTEDTNWFQLIFSHDFAKAFWGEETVCEKCGILGVAHNRHEMLGTIPCSYWIPQWQEHLKEMVIQEDPLQYISKYL